MAKTAMKAINRIRPLPPMGHNMFTPTRVTIVGFGDKFCQDYCLQLESHALFYALLTIVCSCSLLTSSKVKGVNCVECKLLHCEYRAYKGIDYQIMPLQCIVFSGSTCSQLAIEMILISNEADLRTNYFYIEVNVNIL